MPILDDFRPQDDQSVWKVDISNLQADQRLVSERAFVREQNHQPGSRWFMASNLEKLTPLRVVWNPRQGILACERPPPAVSGIVAPCAPRQWMAFYYPAADQIVVEQTQGRELLLQCAALEGGA